ncbi:MAG: hypothetical protein PHF17_10610 [Arcobacteraceae bacterium]|jgi:hypothetical protein|nr:hypothetical protein [Arcobacteraceae bacterium]
MTHYFKLFVSFLALFLGLSLLSNEVDPNSPQASSSKVLYAKYTSYPNSVHTGEKFNVTIEASILLPEDKEFSLFTDIPDVPNLEKKTNEITWYKKDNAKYEATLSFQAKDEPFSFPIIGLSILDTNNSTIDKSLLILDTITFNKLSINKDLYANISASTLSIQNLKIKQYNNDELLCSMEIHGRNSNLKDFKIPNYINQGTKELITKNGEEILYYFVIVPLDTKSIQFQYFNQTTNSLTLLETPIVVEEDLVSTQTDLNPNEGNMGFFKKVFFAFMTTIFLMIYYYKRYKFSLFFAAFFMIILINMMLPNSHMVLKKDQRVYILPTLNSTVFKIINEEEDVEVLMDKNGFKKVLFKNSHIGWVKNE